MPKEYHGNRGWVYHPMQYKHVAPRERRCEIADVLMLFIDESGYLRYTFLQNKRDKKTKFDPKYPLRRVKADPVQWDLLHYRCPLSDSLNTDLPKDCLSSALLNSAATYGIFLNEQSTGEVEMSYHIARNMTLVSVSAISCKNYNRTYNLSTVYNQVNYVNGYWETEGTQRWTTLKRRRKLCSSALRSRRTTLATAKSPKRFCRLLYLSARRAKYEPRSLQYKPRSKRQLREIFRLGATLRGQIWCHCRKKHLFAVSSCGRRGETQIFRDKEKKCASSHARELHPSF